jgi:hypothetical protein
MRSLSGVGVVVIDADVGVGGKSVGVHKQISSTSMVDAGGDRWDECKGFM